jgi:hypothetical protein
MLEGDDMEEDDMEAAYADFDQSASALSFRGAR